MRDFNNRVLGDTHFFILSPCDATSSRALCTLMNTSWMAYSLSMKPLCSDSWQEGEKDQCFCIFTSIWWRTAMRRLYLVLFILLIVFPFKHGLHRLQQEKGINKRLTVWKIKFIKKWSVFFLFAHHVRCVPAGGGEEVVPHQQQQETQRQHVELEVPHDHHEQLGTRFKSDVAGCSSFV